MFVKALFASSRALFLHSVVGSWQNRRCRSPAHLEHCVHGIRRHETRRLICIARRRAAYVWQTGQYTVDLPATRIDSRAVPQSGHDLPLRPYTFRPLPRFRRTFCPRK